MAQFGRALRSGRRGRRFKSCHPDHFKSTTVFPLCFCKHFNISGCSAGGSALDWGSRGRRFKSCHSDQRKVSVFIWILILFFHKIIHGRYSVIFRKMLSIANNGINKPNADYCLIFFKFFQIFYCIMTKTMIKYMLVSHNRVFHCLHNSRSGRTNLIFRGGF